MQTPAYPRPFIITDAAINIAPTLQDKADIVRNAIDLAHAFGIARPRVAILAAVETVNPHMPATLDAAALCKMADRGQIEGAILDGPLAFDNAVSAAAARTKGIVSPVAGAADILVVPDLESGNMLAKQLEYLGGAASAGIVLGARVPIVLTSRADSREARIASCAVALVVARRGRGGRPLSPPRRRAGRLELQHERRPRTRSRRTGDARRQARGDPILVLNCGSSSIKFALFDASVDAAAARSRSGPARSKGIGGTNRSCRRDAATALVLDRRAALPRRVAARASLRRRADRRTAARGGGPPRRARRQQVRGAGARRPPRCSPT